MSSSNSLATVVPVIAALVVTGCSRLDPHHRGLAAEWKSARPDERTKIIDRCVANDFAFLIGKSRAEVVELLGQPDEDAFHGRVTMLLMDGIGYSYGYELSDSVTFDGEHRTHQVLIVRLNVQGRVSGVRTATVQ